METKQKRIAVMVSGGGTNLQALIDAKAQGKLKHGELVLVIASHAGIYAIERAKQAGIQTQVVSRKAYAHADFYADALLQLLKEHRIDCIVLAGFLTVLPDAVCNAYENRIINIHPSLIPSFCGAGYYGLNVHQAVLARGVRVTGATVHFVSSEVDGGPIIAQQAVLVEPEDTPELLQKRVMEQAEWKILPQAIEDFCSDRLRVVDGKVRRV